MWLSVRTHPSCRHVFDPEMPPNKVRGPWELRGDECSTTLHICPGLQLSVRVPKTSQHNVRSLTAAERRLLHVPGLAATGVLNMHKPSAGGSLSLVWHTSSSKSVWFCHFGTHSCSSLPFIFQHRCAVCRRAAGHAPILIRCTQVSPIASRCLRTPSTWSSLLWMGTMFASSRMAKLGQARLLPSTAGTSSQASSHSKHFIAIEQRAGLECVMLLRMGRLFCGLWLQGRQHRQLPRDYPELLGQPQS